MRSVAVEINEMPKNGRYDDDTTLKFDSLKTKINYASCWR